ncbi:SHOCT domain-containing protein [Halosimplex aquaticum]|uniref:SHOCT domain-containing protein n=1 Tax=Halosimplex aquaticum TaxID=3026162 RepID=A0ABD5XZJ6_9EURY|nr:SHOCT domain-containing protein [Halosimplex aquaticum]
MASERGDHGEHDERTDDEGPLVGVAAGAVTFLTLGVAFGLMFLGIPWFWVAFPVGFGGGIPLAVSLAKWYESREASERARVSGRRRSTERSDDTDEALEALRDRYARGEIDDEEFETRVERLLETESVDDAETFLRGDREDEARRRPRAADDGERATDDRDETERA